jgi:hypothetical protein
LVVVAVGFAAWLVFLGLAKFIPAFGIACGLTISIAKTGSAAGFAMTSAMVTTAQVSIVVVAVSTGGILVHKVVTAAEEKPFSWGVAALSVAAAFATQACKEYYFGPKLAWLIVSAMGGLMILVGAAVLKRKGVWAKFLGVLMQLLIPGFVGVLILTDPSNHIHGDFALITKEMWLNLSLLGVLVVVTSLLAIRFREG